MGLSLTLYDTHVQQGAKIVDFGGWDMPLHYGSQIEEHHAVRNDAGMFDVSHMCIVDLDGRTGTRISATAARQRCRTAEDFRQGAFIPAC